MANMRDSPSNQVGTIRALRRDDLGEVVRIHALHAGAARRGYWRGVLERFLKPRGHAEHIGLAAQAGRGLAGYLLGEVRAFEFGSEPCGWVFAVGVDPRWARQGIASRLLAEAADRFRRRGVPRVRTMVRRNEVPVLAFFRSNGFRGGPFVQLELDLEEVS